MPSRTADSRTPNATPHPAQPRAARYLELLGRAAAHIDAHLNDPLDAETLADRSAMSRHHFHRIFRAYFGTTVGGYVTWRRLRRACELLADHPASVLAVAQAVGYESAQALAKAMRRELDTTPSAVRDGVPPHWQRLFERRLLSSDESPEELNVSREIPLQPVWFDGPEFVALTATGFGMTDGGMTQAAQAASREVFEAIAAAGLLARARSCLALMPDEPQGPDDPKVRMLFGFTFDGSLTDCDTRFGRPELRLTGSLRWTRVPAGRHAVFRHVGPYQDLHKTWSAVYRDWLPATGYALRDTPPFEVYVDDPRDVPPERLRTDLYLPVS